MEDDVFEDNKNAMIEAIADSEQNGDQNFFSWFNETLSVEQSFLRGFWDFSHYFLNEAVCKHLHNPETKSCLEIGYGSGRLLNASRNYFNYSHGIDVHSFEEKVEAFLYQQNSKRDFSLQRMKNQIFPLPDNCIDYAYSFIVIQHFYSHEIFVNYLKELQRVVVNNGIINLFFADLIYYPGKFDFRWYKAFFAGFLEELYPPDKNTAYNTLWMSKHYVKKMMRENGFEPVFQRRSYKQVPDGYPQKKGSQTGILAIRI